MADSGLSLRDEPTTPARIDPEAERAVLAAILLDEMGERAVLPRVRQIVDPDDFYDHAYRLVFEAIVRADKGRGVDPTMILAELRAMDKLHTAGGAETIRDIVDHAVTTVWCEEHARLVASHAVARRVEGEARRLELLARQPGATPADLAAGAQRIVDAAAGRDLAADDGSVDTAVDREWERVTADVDTSVRPTGIEALDRALSGGLRGGELVMPGGRPSSGKSALAFQIAGSMAEGGWPVIVFSLEMQRAEVVQRLAAHASGVGLARIRGRSFLPGEPPIYCRAIDHLRGLPLRIFDRPGMRPSEIRAQCLAARARLNGARIGVVVIDYLQKCRPDRPCDNREQEIASVARALKDLAKELDCPVIAPAQLNRGVEGEDRAPTMADYRGSGELEQEADIMLGIHRPKKNPGAREVHVIKQRNGAPGDRVDLAWHGDTAKFIAADPSEITAPPTARYGTPPAKAFDPGEF